MRNVLVFVFAIQLMCSLAWSRQIKMQLQDTTARGSPVHLSGEALFDDDASERIRFSYRIDGSVANTSNRGLMLIVIHFTSSGLKGPPLDYRYKKDYFFSLDVLEPGGIEAFHSSTIRFGMPTVNGEPLPESYYGGSTPVVTAQITFAEFVDGSTWGDVETGSEPLIVRSQTVQELSRLERVLREQGEEVLKDEFSKSDNALPCIGSVMDRCSGKAPSCFVDALRPMIEAVRQHQTDMRPKSAYLGDAFR